LRRELRYRLLQQPVSDSAGTGTALNASSAGIAFTSDRPLPLNAHIEISMSWPVPLQDACPLRLLAKGRVVRCQDANVACAIDKFEFRTQARAAEVTRTPQTAIVGSSAALEVA
jgi:hypothetical protein